MNHKIKLNFSKALVRAALVALVGVTSSVSWALPSDRTKPISLLADRFSFNEKSGAMTYSGNVVIEQGTMKLQAANIVATLNARKEVSVITATGSPTRFQQQVSANKGLAKGQANKIVYNAETGILTLSGNATLEQDGASIKGATLRYSMNKGDIEAVGAPSATGSSGRVQIIIPPSSTKSFPGARD